jgi:nitroreductase
MGLDFFEVMDRRFSVRSFQSTAVEDAKLQAILEAAKNAPSAGNLQAFEIVVIRDPARKSQLAKAALVFLANPDRNGEKYESRGAELYSVQDTTIACTYAQLAATATGLGTCWVGAFDEGKVREIVGAPVAWRPVAILPIGVPAEAAGVRERRALGNLVHEEQVRR